MDADYLKRTVGEALAEGMSQLVLAQPEDNVNFLADFLINYADAVDAQAQLEKDEVREDAELQALQKGELSVIKNEDDSNKSAEDLLKTKLKETTDVFTLLPSVADFIMQKTGASSVTVGQREKGEETPVDDDTPSNNGDFIKYIYASAGSEKQLNQVLLEGEGISWTCWDLPQPSENDEDDTPNEEADENPENDTVADVNEPLKPVPVHCGEVCREPNVKFFRGFPQLGAYLCIGFEYDSCRSKEALGATADTEDQEKPFPRTKQQMILCCDTCKDNRPFAFSSDAVKLVSDIAEQLSEAFERTEVSKMKAEVLRVAEAAERATELTTEVTAFKENLESVGNSALEELGEDATDEAKTLASSRAKLLKATEFCLSCKQDLMNLSQQYVGLNTSSCQGLKAGLVLQGVNSKKFQDHTQISWDKLKMLFKESFFKELHLEKWLCRKFKMPKVKNIEVVQSIVNSVSVDDCYAECVPAGAILCWVKLVLETCAAAEAAAEAEAAKEAEEAAAAKEAEEAAAAEAEAVEAAEAVEEAAE